MRVVYSFFDECIIVDCFAIIAKVKLDVPIDILAFRVPGCATCVWVPRAYGYIRAPFACIGDVICRHGRQSRVLMIVICIL